ncbi:hypothetical protein CDL12_12756 [Handroanthus impetiginosus]|uniref:Uncharacterized protein n=1 Tax=Handroanthus impetiginosus TaxID=429701 RepID=A0A2G9HAS7_9LAMI|nr:hypothetical protein CDL12_12756 [Handroanthus impetiginosus]
MFLFRHGSLELHILLRRPPANSEEEENKIRSRVRRLNVFPETRKSCLRVNLQGLGFRFFMASTRPSMDQ